MSNSSNLRAKNVIQRRAVLVNNEQLDEFDRKLMQHKILSLLTSQIYL